MANLAHRGGLRQLSCLLHPAGRPTARAPAAAASAALARGRISAQQPQPGPLPALGLRPAHWARRLEDPVQRAAAAALQHPLADTEPQVADAEQPAPAAARGPRPTGAFQRLPHVPGSEEHVRSALKRAGRVAGNKALKNRAQFARNLAARRLDALTQNLATPLGRVTRGFPAPGQLHPFERSLLDLTLGLESYERRLARLDALRKSCLEVGKSFAGRAAKAPSLKEAYAVLEEGTERLEAVFRKGAAAVDAVKDIARILRRLPTVDPATPTLALVGAPNVGKSSLVQLLSSGTPEVCDYPFTTRTVKMGHFFVDGARHQVTDTPGLLQRPQAERNAMERLTLACLEHLPTAVLFVADLTGECGAPVAKQWLIRAELRERFPARPWLDVLSKADLLGAEFEAADRLQEEGGAAEASRVDSAAAFAAALPDALRISSVQGTGIEGLKQAVVGVLARQRQED